jgi:hypothetical protein
LAFLSFTSIANLATCLFTSASSALRASSSSCPAAESSLRPGRHPVERRHV